MVRPPPRSPLFPYTTLSDLGSGEFATRRAADGTRCAADCRYPRCSEDGQDLSGAGSEPSDRTALCHAGRFPLWASDRSEEHTSELQSRRDLVCRLLLVKKKS